MSYARPAIFIALFTATSVLAQGMYPQAPVNLKEAEAQGLQRLSVEDLKAFKYFNGTWRLDEGKNAYCLEVYKKKGLDKLCFAVFRAPEGNYYFDYDLENGFYSHTWTPAKAE